MSRRPSVRVTPVRIALRLASVAFLIALFAGRASAHVGGLSGSATRADVPSWLTVATGGVIIGASFLFTSLLTDREAIDAVNAWGIDLPVPGSARRLAVRVGGAVGVLVLALVLWNGLFGPTPGPTTPAVANAAIVVVWAGWWAGFTMSVYLVGDSWPLLNPWRALASLAPRALDRDYPRELGAWPSTVGLLGLVWIEIVSPAAEDPRLLAALVAGYTALTLLGAAVYGAGTWFEYVDPIARVFRTYGRMAPLQRTEEGVEFRLPTAALTDGVPGGTPGAVDFVIALLWATTYDGIVSTPAWEALARGIVGVGVPPLVVYLVGIVAGFLLFRWAYRVASRRARETADSYVSVAFLQRWFVPSLLPIAAGYHVAHFLGYFLSLVPPLLAVFAHPLSAPPDPRALVLPGWFGLLQLGFVLLGHLLAVWVAHARAFDLFPGVLSPIRSQYPFVVVMIVYTMTSMWVIGQPFTPPPYV